MRRAEEGGVDKVVGLPDVADVVSGAGPDPLQVVHGVIPYGVSVCKNHREEVRVFAHVVTDEEECALDIVIPKNVEDKGSSLRYRTVIESEHHSLLHPRQPEKCAGETGAEE